MSEKTLKVLVGALVVALVLWLGVTLASRWGGGGPTAAPSLADIFTGATPAAVSRVMVKGPRDSLALAPEDSAGRKWTVDGFAADSGTVARFFDALKETKIGDLVSTNPGNQAAMGISADSAWVLSLDVGGETRTLLVGNGGPRYNTAYVRLPDEDNVYLATGALRGSVTRTLDDWRNKHILSVDTSAVHRLEVKRDGKSYTLVRADSSWTLTGGEGVDGTSVKDILSELSTLDAAGFFAPTDTLAQVPEGAHLVALSASGDTLAEVTLGSGAADRWARVSTDSVTYRLAGWRVDRLVPKKDVVVGASKKGA